MTLPRLRRAALAILLLAPAAAAAQRPAAPPAGPAETAPSEALLPTDSALRTGTLPNGLRYFIRANGEPDARAELRLVVNAGSVLEDDSQRGLAHLLEHMAFNGTARFPKQQIITFLESVGMRFGPDVNAYTSFDETVYMLTLPTDSAAVLETGLDVLVDWASAITLDSLELERERPVVIEEWRLGQGAESRLRDQQFPVLFQGSRYAERLPIGDTAVIRHAPRSELVRFYRDWYRPDLMAVIVVGDVDAERVERLVRERFGAIPTARAPRPRPVFPIHPHAEPRVSVATDPEATVSTVSMLFKHPPAIQATVGDYRDVLVRALGEGMLNARLGEIAQRPEAPFAYAYASRQPLVRTADAFALAGAAKEGRIAETLASVVTEALRVDLHGFTPTELEREKASLLRAYEQAWAERANTPSAAFAEEYARVFLEGERTPGIAYEYALARRFVPAITLAEVNAAVRAQVTDSNRVLLAAAPSGDSARVPTAARLRAVLDSVRHSTPAPYEDRVASGPLVAEPPAPGRVVRAEPLPAVDAVLWTLSNGVRVFVKPTTFKDDEVVLQGWSPGGHSLAPDSLFVPASTADAVVAQGGLGDFDLVALRKALAGTAAGASVGIDALQETVSGSASPKDVETMLQLVWLRFTAPRADSAAFAAYRERLRTFVENRSREPEAILADTLQVTLAQHHPRARPITLEWLGELDLERSLRFYRERLGDAGDFTLTIVGAVDTAALRPLVERWIGSLPSTSREDRWRDVGIRPPGGVVERTVYAGREPKATTQLVYTGPFDFEPANRMALAALAEVLDIRLREQLREALGGTYGANVSAGSARDPRPQYTVGIAFGSAPERVAELTAAVFAQIDSLRRTGPTADELARVQEMLRRTLQTNAERNGWWAAQLLTHDRYGWDLAMIPDQRRLVDALTTASLRDAARRWLDPSRHVRVTLLPENARTEATP